MFSLNTLIFLGIVCLLVVLIPVFIRIVAAIVGVIVLALAGIVWVGATVVLFVKRKVREFRK